MGRSCGLTHVIGSTPVAGSICRPSSMVEQPRIGLRVNSTASLAHLHFFAKLQLRLQTPLHRGEHSIEFVERFQRALQFEQGFQFRANLRKVELAVLAG